MALLCTAFMAFMLWLNLAATLPIGARNGECWLAGLTMVLLAFLGLAAFVQFGIIEKRVHYR